MNKCCVDCKRMNSGGNIMRGEPSTICVDEKCDCHPYPKKDGMTQVDDNIYLK